MSERRYVMLSDWTIRLRAVFKRTAVEQELDDDGLDQVREECRDARGIDVIDELWRNMRDAVRAYRAGSAAPAVALHRHCRAVAVCAALLAGTALPSGRTLAQVAPPTLLQNATPADRPALRTDQNSMTAHQQLLEKATKGGIDVYFIGDSIARRWGATDYPDFLANWKQNFFGWNAADFGWGADKIENILWRLDNGELDSVNPKVIVILAGTNNVGNRPGNAAKIAEITGGLAGVVHVCRQKAPGAAIILTAIFPRNDNMAVLPEIDQINDNVAKFADGKTVRYLNVNDKLADRDGRLFDGMMNERDKLHPTLKGYQVWADGLKPIFLELLGPPASTDHAPPPTGDPSARGRF